MKNSKKQISKLCRCERNKVRLDFRRKFNEFTWTLWNPCYESELDISICVTITETKAMEIILKSHNTKYFWGRVTMADSLYRNYFGNHRLSWIYSIHTTFRPSLYWYIFILYFIAACLLTYFRSINTVNKVQMEMFSITLRPLYPSGKSVRLLKEKLVTVLVRTRTPDIQYVPRFFLCI